MDLILKINFYSFYSYVFPSWNLWVILKLNQMSSWILSLHSIYIIWSFYMFMQKQTEYVIFYYFFFFIYLHNLSEDRYICPDFQALQKEKFVQYRKISICSICYCRLIKILPPQEFFSFIFSSMELNLENKVGAIQFHSVILTI